MGISIRKCILDDVIVLLLCLLSNAFADAFPGASFSANLPSGKNFTSSEGIIRFWQLNEETKGVEFVNNFGFKSDAFGIYIIGYVINIQMDQSASFKTCIQLNDNPACQTLVSQFNSTTYKVREISLHSTEVLKLRVGDVISVKVVSNREWRSSIGSVFFGQLTQASSSCPAFNANPSSIFQVANGKDQFIELWDTTTLPGSFASTMLFSRNLGQYSVTQSGFYFISANIILEKGPGDETYYLTLVADEKEVSELETSKTSQTITMALYTVLRLKAGTTILLKIRKDGDTLTRVLQESSFSLSMIKGGQKNANGFHVRTLHETSYKHDDTLLKLDAFKKRLFSTMGQNRLFARSKGSYLLCYNLKMMCLFSEHCSVTVKIEKKLKKRVVPFSRQTVSRTLQLEKALLVSNSLVINLLENEEILLKTESTSNLWHLVSGSISFLELREIYPALSASLVAKTKSNLWTKVTNFQTGNRGFGFSLTADLDNGDYVIHRTGIYHVSANIIVNKPSIAMASASITINNNLIQNDGLTMVDSGAKGKCTLNIASSIRLTQGSRVSVYIKVSGISEWEVGNSSVFSLVFLGSANLVIGFQTTLRSDVTQSSAGWNTPSDWIRPSDTTSLSWSFQNKAKLSQVGTFEVPATGIYLASANILLGNADFILKESVFIGMISVNWETGSDLLYARKTRKLQASVNDARNDIGFSISSVLFLRKGDTVAVKVCSKIDPSWTIRKATGFSVVLVSSSELGLATGLLALRQHSNTSLSSGEMILSNWSSVGRDPLLFSTGVGLNTSTDQYLKIVNNGVYLVIVTLHLTMDSLHEITLGLFHNKTLRKTVCAVNTQIYSSSSISCYLTVDLKSGDSFTPYIEIAGSKHKVSIDKACYVSAFRMERPGNYPWFYAELKESFNGTGKLQANSWTTKTAGRLFGNAGFGIDGKGGSFSPQRAGYFLITSNIVFDETGNGIQHVDIETVSANGTRVSSAIKFYTTVRSSAMTFSVAVLLPVSKLGFRQTLQTAEGSIINKKSSFSAAFLPKLSSSDVTELSLQEDEEFSKPGFSSLTKWTSLLTEKPKHFVTDSNSIYFVSIVLLAKLSSRKACLFFGVNDGDTQLQWIVTQTTPSYSTYSFAGIVKSTNGGKLSLGVKLEKGQLLKISRLSKIYATKLGDIDNSIGVISSLELGDPLPLGQSGKSWSIIAKSSKFLNDVVTKDGVLIVKQTGVYILTLALTLQSSGRSIYEVYVRMDGQTLDSIYAKQDNNVNGTISISNSVYLQRGMVLDIVISTAASFVVLPGSYIGIVLLEDLDNNINGILPPVIYKDILPSRKHVLPLGNPITLTCYSVADESILYKWFQNGDLIESGMENTIHLTGQSWESGDYHCEAVASLAKAISKSVRVDFLGSLDCKVLKNICKNDNQTCLNSPEPFQCDCEPGWTLVNGKCLSNKAGPNAEALPGTNIGLPVAAVVLAPIGLLVFLFLIGLTAYTYYKYRKMKHHQRLSHNSSFTERFRHYIPEEEVEINSMHEYEEEITLETQVLHENQRNMDLETQDSREQDDDLDRDKDLDFEDQSYLSISTL